MKFMFCRVLGPSSNGDVKKSSRNNLAINFSELAQHFEEVQNRHGIINRCELTTGIYYFNLSLILVEQNTSAVIAQLGER